MRPAKHWPRGQKAYVSWGGSIERNPEGDTDFDFEVDMEKSYDIEPHLERIPPSVKRHFVSETGLCLSCNIDVKEHRVVFPEEMNDTWALCWTETGSGAHGPWSKHFCVRAEDHPGHQTRDEFEELYG